MPKSYSRYQTPVFDAISMRDYFSFDVTFVAIANENHTVQACNKNLLVRWKWRFFIADALLGNRRSRWTNKSLFQIKSGEDAALRSRKFVRSYRPQSVWCPRNVLDSRLSGKI
jgi:hypothetical protein